MDKNASPAPQTLQTGRLGEEAAAAFLENLGWKIAARNFHGAKGEIDIIAWKNERLLVFVEVKTRADDLFATPQSAIDSKKQQNVSRAAGVFMHKIGHEGAIRFDVVTVLLRNGEVREIKHIEDAFFPGI